MDVYEEISEEHFNKIKHKCGKPIPTMCVLTIKYKNGYSDRAKCRIVVLGNQQQQIYSNGEKYAPVITQNQFRFLLSLAIRIKRLLKQCDVKNAFCNGKLPDDEVVVIKPPKGCPISKPKETEENPLWPRQIPTSLVQQYILILKKHQSRQFPQQSLHVFRHHNSWQTSTICRVMCRRFCIF